MGNSENNIGNSISDGFKDLDINKGVFRTRIFRVSELMDMLKSQKLQFIGGKPFKVWSLSHKSRFIESLLLGLPLDPIIIDGADSPWFVADGAELLSTIYGYIQNEFSLDYVNFNMADYFGETYKGLPLMFKRRLMNLEISATIINPSASYIYRIGVYSSALLKSGKEKDLWKCAEAVYANSFKDLKEMAFSLKAKDPQPVLQIIIAMLCDNWFKTGSPDELEGLRFDMFECLVLGAIDKVYGDLKTLLEKKRETIRDVLNLVEEYKDDLTTKTGKKLRIFIIVLTILATDNKGYDIAKKAKQFKRAWNASKGKGIGYLNKDYATKSSVIYKYLNR